MLQPRYLFYFTNTIQYQWRYSLWLTRPNQEKKAAQKYKHSIVGGTLSCKLTESYTP